MLLAGGPVLGGEPGFLWLVSLLLVLVAYLLRRGGDAWRKWRGRTTLGPFGNWPILPLLLCHVGLLAAIVLLRLAWSGVVESGGRSDDIPQSVYGALVLIALVILGCGLLTFASRIVIDAQGVECHPRWYFGRRRSFPWEEVVSWEVTGGEGKADHGHQGPNLVTRRFGALRLELAEGSLVRFGPGDCFNRLEPLIEAFRVHVLHRLADHLSLRLPTDAVEPGRGAAAEKDDRIAEGPSDRVR
jgi:hypothetical protein